MRLRLSFPWSATVALAALLAPAALTKPTTVHAATASTAATPQARVIVKFKTTSSVLRSQTQSVSAAQRLSNRAQTMGTRLGLSLQSGLAIDGQTQVVFASNITSADLAARLAAQSDVEYAVVDVRRHAISVPNDPYYSAGPFDTGTSGGPTVGQWYLRAPTAATTSASAVASSINIETAWTVVSDALAVSPHTVVVAVLDSGVRFDHADLGGGTYTSPGGNLLAGYDFVSGNSSYPSQPYAVANDGDGRDADPSDPGDWVTDAESTTVGGPFYGCTVENSSWHGTQTTGMIAAVTDNSLGIAGVGHNQIKVLPVRVLGKCGGYDSDIAAGMLWAAGITANLSSDGVSDVGIPANPNPAKVISLSLGGLNDDGTNTCGQIFTDTLAKLTAAGVTVVAAAGNGDSAGTKVMVPASCSGVIAVAGLRQAGDKVGFSNLGSQVAISAPGGNCVNASGACLYPMMSTTNAGTTTPVAGDSSYTDSYSTAALGTSFSAPLVAGTAALMLAANSALTPSDVLSRLQSSARAFVTTGAGTGIAQCTDPGTSGTVGECYCTTATCGAGMLDASAAVLAAVGGVQAHITVSPTTPQAGQSVTFDASTSIVASGRSIASYAWSITSEGGIVSGFTTATNGATASVLPSGAGSFTVKLTVTDSTGATSTFSDTVTVAAVVSTTTTTTTTSTSTQSSSSGGGAFGAEGALLVVLAAAAVRRRRRRTHG